MIKINKIAWVGTRTAHADNTAEFFRDILGLGSENPTPDFWVLKMSDGAKVEVYGPKHPHNRHFTTGPVVGFLVDDVFDATEDLRASGAEILQEPQEFDGDGNAWVHFRGPDGNIYEFTQDPGVRR